jgi:hypothetical protein
MFRRPLVWVVLVAAAVLGVVVAVLLFPRAMPFVTLDLRMDRASALSAARELAARHGWGPEGYRQAAAFRSDETVQAYVELEGGGNEAFGRMLAAGLYRPYTWQVRLFREHEPRETLIRFTPEGEPYGFRETLSEDAAGAALGAAEARRIAEGAAVETWGVDLSALTPLEAGHETLSGGRVDHTFVYERPEPKGRVGEERYRLRLVVSGDRLSELTWLVEVPEAFERRYSEMRSRNSLVSAVSNGVVFVLYGGGAIVGLFLLLRKRWVVWRPALALSGVIGLLTTAAFLSQWPLGWMEYDTAVSAASFAAQTVVYAILNGLFLGLLAMIAIVAGESLTRRAFPRHPQLFGLWSPEGACSRQVLGRTVGAYLLVGTMLAYLTLLYAFAREELGWWLPSASLTDPNVVAAFVPWLFPLAISLQAGVVEEVVFRAIPLAGAVLLGRRFGGQRYWVAGALFLQAVLFGAAHADYPAQPAWARLVEIAIPFVFIGAIYLIFGLLPAVVMHFVFDVVMFSLPLFASSAPGVWIDRSLVVVLALVPIWVVLLARWRRGSWRDLPDALRNGAWTPPVAEEARPVAQAVAPRAPMGRRSAMGLSGAGLLGLVLWGTLTPFHADAPPVGLTKASAVAAARRVLEGRGVSLDESWRELPSVAGSVGPADLFVWQEGGPETYRSVIGSHIETPHWQVRYARFEGDVAERAEEYVVHVDSAGEVFRVEHPLPEGREGPSLSRDEASSRVEDAIRSTLGLDPSGLREVSAEPSERPARRDWTFIFEDPAVEVGGRGEARLAVTLAGDEVEDVFRHVHVPEEWQRAAQERFAREALISTVCGAPVGLGLLAAAVAGLVGWSRGRFARTTFLAVSLGLVVVLTLRALNAWPMMSAGFSTSQPWGTQALIGIGAGVIGAVFLAVLLGLVAGFAHQWLPPGAPMSRAARVARGAALGAAWAGLAAVVSAASPSLAPLWGSLAGAGSTLPWLASSLEAIRGWAMRTLLLLLLVGLATWLSRGGAGRRVLTPLVLIGSGLILYGAGGVQPLSTWLITGLGTGVTLWLSYQLVLRFQPSLVPLATAVMGILALGREAAWGAYPGATPGAVLAIVVLGVLGLWWTARLDRDTPPSEESVGRTS